jgi:tetratricopeptide (TPR) repeat protein
MNISEPKLQHIPFFEALSRAKEGSTEWRLTSAGLVTLRLFDAWLVEGPAVVAADAWGLRAVRDSINAVEGGSSSKAILESIVDAMADAHTVRVPLVAPRLLAYARALQFEGCWDLAADVHRTVIAHAHPFEEADIVIAANMQLGTCLRTLADWDEATAAFARAGYSAAMSGDIMMVLRARIYEAKISIERGNLPHAQSLLEAATREADASGLREVRSMAVHDRADIAFRRGQYDLAVTLGYEALEGYTDPSLRDRVLGDIAAAFFELGLRDAARDAYLILAATAQEQHTRWVATINLLECAAADGREPIFEQYRRELADAALPAMLACHYQFYVGEGYRIFGKMAAARAALSRSLELAERHGIGQAIFRAEQSLRSLDQAGVVIIANAPALTPDVERVATAVRNMRELAGVAG